MEEFVVSSPNRKCILNWYRARRSIFILACYESLLHGIELTMLEPTEYFFYKNELETRSPILMYSLSLGLNNLAFLVCSIFTSHVLSRYQCFTGSMITLTLLSLIGHCMYFVSRSPAVIIVGRFVSGLGKTTNLISTSFLKTLYPTEDLAYKTTILTNFITFGTIIGPVLTYIFLQIDIDMGAGIQLNFGNSGAFYMFLCKMVLLVGAYLFMDDIPGQRTRDRFQYAPRGNYKTIIQNFCCACRAEEDENENLVQRFDAEEEFLRKYDDEEFNKIPNNIDNDSDDVMTTSSRKTTSKRRIPIKQALSMVLQHDKVVSILFTLFLHGLTFKLINSLIPVEAYRYLKWDIEEIAGLCIGNSVLGTLIAFVIALCFSTSTHFLNLIGGFFLGMFSLVLLGTIPHYVIKMVAANLLFCLMSFFNVVASCLIGLSARMVLNHLTDQKLKNFTNFLRMFTLEMSYFFGSLLLPLVDMDLGLSMSVGLFVTLTSIVFMILKLKNIWV